MTWNVVITENTTYTQYYMKRRILKSILWEVDVTIFQAL